MMKQTQRQKPDLKITMIIFTLLNNLEDLRSLQLFCCWRSHYKLVLTNGP